MSPEKVGPATAIFAPRAAEDFSARGAGVVSTERAAEETATETAVAGAEGDEAGASGRFVAGASATAGNATAGTATADEDGKSGDSAARPRDDAYAKEAGVAVRAGTSPNAIAAAGCSAVAGAIDAPGTRFVARGEATGTGDEAKANGAAREKAMGAENDSSGATERPAGENWRERISADANVRVGAGGTCDATRGSTNGAAPTGPGELGAEESGSLAEDGADSASGAEMETSTDAEALPEDRRDAGVDAAVADEGRRSGNDDRRAEPSENSGDTSDATALSDSGGGVSVAAERRPAHGSGTGAAD